jgi:uncharacterized protein (DUF2249 family)
MRLKLNLDQGHPRQLPLGEKSPLLVHHHPSPVVYESETIQPGVFKLKASERLHRITMKT